MKTRNTQNTKIISTLKTVMVLAMVTLGLSAVNASTYYVPADYPSIKEAVDASTHGDIIIVADGTWSGPNNRNIDMSYKDIQVMSANGPELCTIDVGNSYFGFKMTTGKIEGFTIKNATQSGQGFGVYFSSGGGRVTNCVLEDNNAGLYGEYCSGVDVVNCIVQDNEQGGLYCINSEIDIFNSQLSSPDDEPVHGRSLSIVNVYNCLIMGNAMSYQESIMNLANCTIIGDVEMYEYAEAHLTNSIVWGGGLSYGASAYYTVTYCNTETLYPGEGNISSDPMFVAGPGGAYYLGQVASGQASDSPCVDAGADDADVTCYQAGSDQFCMGDFITRTDEEFDTGTVDMGYHYPEIGTMPGTPTPTPTADPTMTPTPTPTPPVDLGVSLHISEPVFTGGEQFLLKASCTVEKIDVYDLYVALEIDGGAFIFYPTWTSELDHSTIAFDSSNTRDFTILKFDWPENGVGAAGSAFVWSLMTNQNTFDIVGNYDREYFEFF